MFMLKSLFGRVWSDPNAAELAQISTGQLFLVRPNSPKGGRECLFNNAMATIRRTGTEFHYQLVIIRVFEEGEEQLLDEEDETSDEKSFLIDEALEFQAGEYEKAPTFSWKDLSGEPGDIYEFVAQGTNGPTSAFFMTSLLKAVYERKNLKSSENVSDAELQALLNEAPSKPPAKRGKAAKKSSNSEGGGLVQSMQKLQVSDKSPSAPTPSPLARDNSFSKFNNMPVRAAEPAQFYWFDPQHAHFQLQAEVEARIVETAQFEYWLMGYEGDQSVIAHQLNAQINGRSSEPLLSYTWNSVASGTQQAWCFRFGDTESYSKFTQTLAHCLYEVHNQISWAKAKADEQQYAIQSYQEDVIMSDAEEDEVAGDLDVEAEDSASDEEEDEAEDEDAPKMPKDTSKNSQLTVGYKNDRSFVLRGTKIGVFRHTNDHKVEYAATLNKVATPQGKAFAPKHVMLHDQDSTMVLMDPSNRHSLFKMDIEVGKVVEEWKIHDDIQVDNIAPDSKFAQMTPQQTFVGASHNGLFRIDPRQSGNKIVDSQFKQYATKNAFSSVATTDAGKVAVASNKGDIRLFDAIGKNAKTALPALGDPILGVDVTKNGRWIIATCKTYLLLLDTLIGDGRYKGSLGFDRAFPAEAKPMPRRLQLRPEHVAYMGSEISFTPARFNTGPDQEESTIVTSCGRFVIAWDFAKVKAGKLDKYEIKQYDDTVVQDNFRFGNDKEIIVALENNVLMVNKKALRKPTRTSLSTPTSNLRSHSEIVNSPY